MRYLMSPLALGGVALIGATWGVWYLGHPDRLFFWMESAFGALCAIGAYALIVAIIRQFQKKQGG